MFGQLSPVFYSMRSTHNADADCRPYRSTTIAL